VLALTGERVFREDFHADFHRSIEDAIDLGFKNDDFPNAHLIAKVDVVDGGGDYVTVRMAAGGHCGGHVNQVHDVTAKEFSERVGISGENDFGHFRTRCTHRFAFEWGLRGIVRFSTDFRHSFLGYSGSWERRSQPLYYLQTMTDQKKTRRELLENFVAQKPDDAFSRYGLAMECLNSGDTVAAETQFRELLTRNADYVPAYLMFAQMLVKELRQEEAREVLNTGITAASQAGNGHALSEMESLLSEL